MAENCIILHNAASTCRPYLSLRSIKIRTCSSGVMPKKARNPSAIRSPVVKRTTWSIRSTIFTEEYMLVPKKTRAPTTAPTGPNTLLTPSIMVKVSARAIPTPSSGVKIAPSINCPGSSAWGLKTNGNRMGWASSFGNVMLVKYSTQNPTTVLSTTARRSSGWKNFVLILIMTGEWFNKTLSDDMGDANISRSE
uniref:Uncharacterized protein n=1 Tax=Romanomermis culicivorax TaxID=13658 RepID=A0A915JUH7_ROMCU